MTSLMPSLTLKNVPRDLHRKLKDRARTHHRSLNKEVIATVQSITDQTPAPDIDQMSAEAREMRSKFKRPVSLDEIQTWKVAGRRR